MIGTMIDVSVERMGIGYNAVGRKIFFHEDEPLPTNVLLSSPFVCLWSKEDPFIWLGLESREEVNNFIASLQSAADRAFAPTVYEVVES